MSYDVGTCLVVTFEAIPVSVEFGEARGFQLGDAVVWCVSQYGVDDECRECVQVLSAAGDFASFGETVSGISAFGLAEHEILCTGVSAMSCADRSDGRTVVGLAELSDEEGSRFERRGGHAQLVHAWHGRRER